MDLLTLNHRGRSLFRATLTRNAYQLKLIETTRGTQHVLHTGHCTVIDGCDTPIILFDSVDSAIYSYHWLTFAIDLHHTVGFLA